MKRNASKRKQPDSLNERVDEADTAASETFEALKSASETVESLGDKSARLKELLEGIDSFIDDFREQLAEKVAGAIELAESIEGSSADLGSINFPERIKDMGLVTDVLGELVQLDLDEDGDQ